MYCYSILQASSSGGSAASGGGFFGRRVSPGPPLMIRLPRRRLTLLSMSYSAPSVEEASQPSVSANYTASVGPPLSALQLSQWNLTHRHILMLNVVACAAAVSATWLFFSAIPTLLAFKRAAESLEKLMDTAREELPDTMASIRLSGMEISDLTMELNDLGQEITQGVRSSTRAVRVAEERLRGMTNMMRSPASVQGLMVIQETEPTGPAVAVAARRMRERIVQGRSLFHTFLSVFRFSRWALSYLASRKRK